MTHCVQALFTGADIGIAILVGLLAGVGITGLVIGWLDGAPLMEDE